MQSMNLSMTPYTQAGTLLCSQYDVGRTITVNLLDESGTYEIPTGATIKIEATKPSGLGFSESCTWSGSVVTITLTETMTEEGGRFPAELVVTSGSTVLGTANFLMKVENSPHPDGTTDGNAETLNSLEVRVTALENTTTSGLDATDVTSGYVPTAQGDDTWEWQAQSGGGGGGGTSPSPYTSAPSALGTASAGSSTMYSRGDHVHPMPSASDVGALPSNTAYVSSVNGSTGAVTISNATTSAAGLMSADDKSHLNAVYADYSSAITALGV